MINKKQTKKINRKEYLEKYNKENRDKINKRRRKHREKNKDEANKKRKEYRMIPEVKQRDKENYQKPENQVKKKAYRKKYNSREDIKEKRNLDRRERLKIDAKYAITCRLRCRLNHAITDYTMDGKIKKSRDYEIDYEAIIEHLKPFPKDRKKYHIDHIMPLISFNLNNPDEVKIAFAPGNHQWLLVEDNQSKGAKIPKEVKQK